MVKILATVALLSISLAAEAINFSYAPKTEKRVVPNAQSQLLSYNDTVKEAMQSVVNISTKRTTKNNFSNNPLGQMFNDPFFKEFFGGRNFGDALPQERVERSLGSGVIVTQDGYIVTNNHVVEEADEIVVTIGQEQKEYSATIIGTDEGSDLALIKIEAKSLKPLKLSQDTQLLVGDVVFAIGNPFGVGQTVTKGIISATNRDSVGNNRYENFIQTDTSINPGNSGGALIDSRGALIGINSAILTRSGANNGIGFAIPVNMVEDIISKLAISGKVDRGYMGVSIADLSSEAKSVYSRDSGALVMNVSEGTPASNAGIKRGDLIYGVDDKKIESASDLTRIIGSYDPGDSVKLKIERDKKTKEVTLTLGSVDSAQSASQDGFIEGLKLSEITKELAQKYRISDRVNGVLIVDVKPASKAETIGFQPGDVIVQVESIEIADLNDLDIAANEYKDSAKRVFINRYGQTLMQIVE
ncbi:MAG: Do family serine endopeptidase [Campylobacterota bacterium]